MRLFTKVVKKATESTHEERGYRQAKMQSLQFSNAMNKELERLVEFIDKSVLLSTCKNQMQNSAECKWDGEAALNSAFQEFSAVVTQYCEIILDQSKPDEKVNKILEEMCNAVKQANPPFGDLTKNIWNIKLLLAKMTNEAVLSKIDSYHFFADPNKVSQEEIIELPRCTIL
ncbi:MAG: hypothetical protein SFW66_02970 [Gammaproteobacteria bacterium]|nr:hypothetical protein [Gammaproteobacteria bacterium]